MVQGRTAVFLLRNQNRQGKIAAIKPAVNHSYDRCGVPNMFLIPRFIITAVNIRTALSFSQLCLFVAVFEGSDCG